MGKFRGQFHKNTISMVSIYRFVVFTIRKQQSECEFEFR